MSTLIGLDGNVTIMNEPYENPDFVNKIKEIAPQVYRTPGSAANDYGWRVDSPSLAQVKKMYDVAKPKLIFVLNMLTKRLPNNLNMLRSAKSMGLPIDFVEFGNELNNVGRAVYPTALAYAETAADWAQEIKIEFPDTKFICVGENKGREKWNEAVINMIPEVFLVTHWHCSKQYVFDGIPNVDILKADLEENQRIVMPGIPANRIFMTEWNLQEGSHETKHSPDLKDAAAVNLAMTTIMQKIVDMGYYGACFHNVIGGDGYGAISSNRFFGTDLTPTGTAIKNFISTMK